MLASDPLVEESDLPVLNPDRHYYSFQLGHNWPPNLRIILLLDGVSVGVALAGSPFVLFAAFGAFW